MDTVDMMARGVLLGAADVVGKDHPFFAAQQAFEISTNIHGSLNLLLTMKKIADDATWGVVAGSACRIIGEKKKYLREHPPCPECGTPVSSNDPLGEMFVCMNCRVKGADGVVGARLWSATDLHTLVGT